MPDLPVDSVVPQERISRFILKAKYFDAEQNWISPENFMPRKPKREGEVFETSVYRTAGLEDLPIWVIGDNYVTPFLRPSPLPGLARADLQAEMISLANLLIVPHPDPHPLHANIRAWPNSPEERKMKAQLLAQRAVLVPRKSSADSPAT